MAKLDKEIFDKLQADPNEYEYIPLPAKVTYILKRKYKDEILVSFIVKRNNKRIKMLVYFKNSCHNLSKTNGYSSDISTWEELAESVANSYPQYRVKHYT